jgi:hypothetical protein
MGELSKCIEGIETSVNKSGEKTTKIKLANRDNALEKLSVYMGLLRQQMEHSGKIDTGITITDLRNAYLNKNIEQK